MSSGRVYLGRTEAERRMACRRVIYGGEQAKVVASQMGVTPTTIRRWCNRFRKEEARA